MRFSVADLLKKPTGTRWSCSIDEPFLEPESWEVKIVAPVVGTVVATRSTQGVLVTGSLGTAILAECRRCLDSFTLGVTVDLGDEFVPSTDVHTGASLPIPDDTDPCLVIDKHHMLDLTEVIRQSLLLSASTWVPCRPDCAGLCPQCGQNLNEGTCDCSDTDISSPFIALKELLEEDTRQGV